MVTTTMTASVEATTSSTRGVELVIAVATVATT